MGEIMNGLGFWNGALIILVLILLFRTMGFSMRITRLERKYKMFMKGSDAASLEKSFARKFGQIDQLFEAKEDQEKAINLLQNRFDLIFSKYGIEKYDAFDDVGGKLSFALALLDKDNTGLILNAVHSRDNCFLYLKEIFKGESYVMLSQEEVEALRKAVNFEMDELATIGKKDNVDPVELLKKAEEATREEKKEKTTNRTAKHKKADRRKKSEKVEKLEKSETIQREENTDNAEDSLDMDFIDPI